MLFSRSPPFVAVPGSLPSPDEGMWANASAEDRDGAVLCTGGNGLVGVFLGLNGDNDEGCCEPRWIDDGNLAELDVLFTACG